MSTLTSTTKSQLTANELRKIADFIENFDAKLMSDRLVHFREFVRRYPNAIHWHQWPHELLLGLVLPEEIPQTVLFISTYIPEIYTRLPPIVWCESKQQYSSIHTISDKPKSRVIEKAMSDIKTTNMIIIPIRNPSRVQRSELWVSPAPHACVICKEIGRRQPYVSNVMNLGCGHLICCLNCVGWYTSKNCWACSKSVTEWMILAPQVVK
jgi:hypothetical protein